MPTLHVILVATDFSPTGTAAVEYAAWLASTRNAKLYILHVFHQPILFGRYQDDLAVPGGIDPAGMAELGDALAARLEALAETYRADGIALEARIVDGRPSLEIAKAAEVLGATMIVTGTQGRGRLGRFLLGSTASSVVRRAPCPVVSAPIDVLEDPGVNRRDPRTTRILVATDFSRPAEFALQYAIEMAEGTNGRIDLIHVVDGSRLTVPLDPLVGAHPALLEGVLRLKDRMQARIDDLIWEVREHGLASDGYIFEGAPAEEIVRFAAENDIDFIVLGSVGRGAWNGLLLGSVADALLRTAPVPVITCGPHLRARRGHHLVFRLPRPLDEIRTH